MTTVRRDPRGAPIARKRSTKRRSGKRREWQDLRDQQATQRAEEAGIEGDQEGPDLEPEYDDKWLEEAEQEPEDLHKSLEKADKTWGWMAEGRNARMFSEIEERMAGVLGKGPYEWVDRRVLDEVFDQSTLLAVFKLMTQGHIDTLEWPIARGKEAHVFRGESESGPVAVKIFHTSNAVFRGLMQYIEGDPRFGGLRRRHRQLVEIWVRKEQRNLLRMRKFGLRVPEPFALFKNVLVMSYVGDETGPAPRLRDAEVESPQPVYDELLEFLRILWNDAGMVHADFSDYNILWHDGEPWVIDAGQSVVERHPNSNEFLVRDATRLVQWATRQGLEVELADAMVTILGDE